MPSGTVNVGKIIVVVFGEGGGAGGFVEVLYQKVNSRENKTKIVATTFDQVLKS